MNMSCIKLLNSTVANMTFVNDTMTRKVHSYARRALATAGPMGHMSEGKD